MEGLRVKLLNENSSNDTYVVAWDPLYLIPDFYHVQIESVDYGYKVDTVPGVSFLYIMIITIKTNQ